MMVVLVLLRDLNPAFTKEEVEALLNERMKKETRIYTKKKMEQMGDLIKRLKNCVRWFKSVEEGYVQDKEKLQEDLDSAEKKLLISFATVWTVGKFGRKVCDGFDPGIVNSRLVTTLERCVLSKIMLRSSTFSYGQDVLPHVWDILS
ncbi:hypothetical protein TSUD_273740 [Trifolium subterraneum]|uniref:Uncharacterized protein n=1 Tax=Trifolium subterraneum TaxID=3900 RepID=A0A2Z6NME6_TRISU|nr:hypothetical protein TSUD_273740 [Trifolium subterraneum]